MFWDLDVIDGMLGPRDVLADSGPKTGRGFTLAIVYPFSESRDRDRGRARAWAREARCVRVVLRVVSAAPAAKASRIVLVPVAKLVLALMMVN